MLHVWQSSLLKQQMPWSYSQKLAVIGDNSAPMTDNKKNLEEASLDQKLETVKCITYSLKLNKGNEEVLALIDSRNKANLIS